MTSDSNPEGERVSRSLWDDLKLANATDKTNSRKEMSTNEHIDPVADPERQYTQLVSLVRQKPREQFVVTITPQLANLILDRFPKINRGIRRTKIVKWAKKMREGKWNVNGDSVKFLHNGKLGTGQHRLLACIEAGVPFMTYIAFVETIEGEGQGISQSRKDIFEENNVKYPRETSKAVAHIKKAGDHRRLEYDPDEDYDFYKWNISGPKMEEAISAGKVIAKKVKGLIPEDVLYATLYALFLKNSVKAWQLVGQIRSDTKTGKVLLRRIEEVRAYIPGGESGKTYISALIVKAYNANKQGVRLTAIQGPNVLDWDRSTSFPEIA